MKTRRMLFVVMLAVLLGAAVVLGNPRTPKPATVPVVPAAERGAVWYCPGLPPKLPIGDERVTFANVGNAAADVVVTVLTDSGETAHVTFTLPAATTVTKRRGDIGGPGALTVETFGGQVVVEDALDGSSGTDTSPCAADAGTSWSFAAGTTVRGAQQWLVIDDPFASDAKVDITLRTSSGLRRPEKLQSLDVTRRSRVVVPIHDQVVLEPRVAVTVEARLGRVVAAQALVFTADAGAPGVAFTVGTPGVSNDVVFAEGTRARGANEWLAIANVGDSDAEIDVQTLAEGSQPVIPLPLTVAQDDITWVQLGGCAAGAHDCIAIPDDVRFGLDVHGAAGSAIVAQTLTRFTDKAQLGATTSIGEQPAARLWVFARDRLETGKTTTLAFVNPLATDARVNVGLVHDGTVQHPAGLQGIRVPVGRRVTITVVDAKTRPAVDAALVVDATSAVAVERSITGGADVSRSVGVLIR